MQWRKTSCSRHLKVMSSRCRITSTRSDAPWPTRVSGYLLADEVGLGKTIEAGLIMRELKLRGLVRRTLVVAPKGLVTQWVSEMRTHFNEDFQLLVPGEFGAYRRFAGEENLWRRFDQVVCSMDSVKPMDARRGWGKEQAQVQPRALRRFHRRGLGLGYRR